MTIEAKLALTACQRRNQDEQLRSLGLESMPGSSEGESPIAATAARLWHAAGEG